MADPTPSSFNPYDSMNQSSAMSTDSQSTKQHASGGVTHTVRNRTAAPIQITAEQILRETQEYREQFAVAPKQYITSVDELNAYKARKRKEYEDKLRGVNKHNIGMWLKYAKFESSHYEYERARSIYERAVDIDYTNHSIWVAYATMEMSGKFVNHARNIWDRAVTLLPRVDILWYKYTYMEEILGNIDGCRRVFERWMAYEPDERAWYTYIKFEIRQNEIQRARDLYSRVTILHHNVNTYLQWTKFERKYGSVQSTRSVYERALNELLDDAYNEDLLLSFAEYETSQREYQRVRTIYQYALDHLSKEQAKKIFQHYVTFEKQYGSIDDIERTVIAKRRFEYEEQLKNNPYNYDVWFDYIKMQQSDMKNHSEHICNNSNPVILLFERAIVNLPPVEEKQYYKRYIYLWIAYVLYTEVDCNDAVYTRSIYQRVLQLIPVKKFTFAKLYILAAQFELRQGDLSTCRKLLGTAIGVCHNKDKIFAAYIDIEYQLGNIDRCRILYERQLQIQPTHASVWLAYIDLESTLEEYERVRALYQLLINNDDLYNNLNDVNSIWRSYIQFETEQGQYDKVRELYELQIQRSKERDVAKFSSQYIEYAEFEIHVAKEYDKARQIYMNADEYYKSLKNTSSNAQRPLERLNIIQSWLSFEKQYGSVDQQNAVQQKLPTQVTKRRELRNDDGQVEGYEEYIDYIYEDEQPANVKSNKLLELAKQWKLRQQQQQNQQSTSVTNGDMNVDSNTADNTEEIDIG